MNVERRVSRVVSVVSSSFFISALAFVGPSLGERTPLRTDHHPSPSPSTSWVDVRKIKWGAGAEWVFANRAVDDTAVVRAFRTLRVQIIRFPGGLFSNYWSLSRGRMLDLSVPIDPKTARRRDWYDGPLGHGGLARLVPSRAAHAASELGAQVVWVVSPYSPWLLDDAKVAARLTPPGDTLFLELGNELYDGYYLRQPITVDSLARLAAVLEVALRGAGVTAAVALPTVEAPLLAASPDRARWDAQSLDSTPPGARTLHIYVDGGWTGASNRTLSPGEILHQDVSPALARAARKGSALWLTEVNLNAYRPSVELGKEHVTAGSAKQGLLVSDLLMELAASRPGPAMILIHSLMESKPYGMFSTGDVGSPDSAIRFRGTTPPVVLALAVLVGADSVRWIDVPPSQTGEDPPRELEVRKGAQATLLIVNWNHAPAPATAWRNSCAVGTVLAARYPLRDSAVVAQSDADTLPGWTAARVVLHGDSSVTVPALSLTSLSSTCLP